jgi:cytochrome b6-f complex iron-sulfur subunit
MISVLAQNAHAHSYDVIVSLMIYQFILVSLTIVSLHAVVLQPAAFASITTTNLNKNMPVSFSSSTRTTAVSAVHVPVSSSQQQNENVLEDPIHILDRRRAILNLILSSAATATTTTTFPANAFSLGGSSSTTKKEIKPTTAADIAGNPIIAKTFLSKHKVGDRTMVQGLRGDPTYLIVKTDQDQLLQLESYALNAECTHLGCVVPWDPNLAKFVCPCHGSQYDAKGSVLRGPAPSSLKLNKVGVEEESGKVLLEPWTEDDFRSGEKPWWI